MFARLGNQTSLFRRHGLRSWGAPTRTQDLSTATAAVAVGLAALLGALAGGPVGQRIMQSLFPDAVARKEAEKSDAAQLTEFMMQLNNRLDKRLDSQTERTAQELTGMRKQLSILNTTEDTLTGLNQKISQLEILLSDKQARGKFGEAQLEMIVRDSLPAGSYDFQVSVADGKRVDCMIYLPVPPRKICVDSKFPLESWVALVESSNASEEKAAIMQFGKDVKEHIKDVSSKYIVPGETADSAIMFIPSEAVYAGIHRHLPDVVDFSRSRRVNIAGPNSIMLLIHTLCSILRDARMQEHAAMVQIEVSKLMQDVQRLSTRVNKLGLHFQQVNKDVMDIQTSASKILRAGDKIEQIDFDDRLAPEQVLEG